MAWRSNYPPLPRQPLALSPTRQAGRLDCRQSSDNWHSGGKIRTFDLRVMSPFLGCLGVSSGLAIGPIAKDSASGRFVDVVEWRGACSHFVCTRRSIHDPRRPRSVGEHQQPLLLSTLAPFPPALYEIWREERQSTDDRDSRRLVQAITALEQESRERPHCASRRRIALGSASLAGSQQGAPPRHRRLPKRIACNPVHGAKSRRVRGDDGRLPYSLGRSYLACPARSIESGARANPTCQRCQVDQDRCSSYRLARKPLSA